MIDVSRATFFYSHVDKLHRQLKQAPNSSKYCTITAVNMRAAAGGPATAVTYSTGALLQTSLLLIWAFSTLCWSIFTPPHKTFAARVILFQPFWVLRSWKHDTSGLRDLFLFELVHAVYSYYSGAWRFPSLRDSAWLDFNDYTIQVYFQVFTLLGICGLFAGGIVERGKRLASAEQAEPPLRGQRIDDQVLPPLLLTSRTTHSRIFPRKNTFSYSYLFVGIPIGVEGRISKVLSVDSKHRSWFTVDSGDYLDRIHDKKTTLAEKLKTYLHSQGVSDNDYAYAYLVTAPRFLGYCFNPVSFWYLYDSDVQLKYMILEVNNTFDERRMYLLNASDSVVESKPDPTGKATVQRIFTNKWEKDLHVSPFSSRKGSYSLRATDPLEEYERTGKVKVDNTIVLISSGDHAKVVARVFTEGDPKDPATITPTQLTKFIALWWWVGFATMPRTIWQAFKLMFLRKLHVWYKPEVMPTSVGRAYTDDERTLETIFREFLSHAVHSASRPLRVVYEPAHGAHTEVVWYSPSFSDEKDRERTLTLKVISPAFYSRFIHYRSAKEAFDGECLISNVMNRTAALDNTDMLSILISAMQSIQQQQQGDEPPQKPGLVGRFQLSIVRVLRCPTAAVSYPDGVELSKTACSTGASELDLFVGNYFEDPHIYRRAVIKLFLSERLAFGFTPLLQLIDWLIRVGLLLASMLYCDNSRYVDILRPRPLEKGDIKIMTLTLVLANNIHLWRFLKG